MAMNDKNNWKNIILKEFQKINEFNSNLRLIFYNSTLPYVTKLPYTSNQKSINELMLLFAKHFVQIMEATIYKNDTYTDYRLNLEINHLQKVLDRGSKPKIDNKFDQEITKLFNQLAIDNFPAIFDLSGNGFRLLNLNLQLFANDFLSDLHFELNKS